MTVKHMYLALFAAALVAGFLLHLLDAGISSATGFGETIGRVGVLFLVAALVPTVMVLLSRERRGSAADLTAVGIIVLAAFSHCSYRGMEVHRALTAFSFEAPGCTFSAIFPEPPELKELVLAGGLLMTQANFYRGDTFLRAECLPTDGRFAPTREAVIAELRKHTHRDGLMDVELEIIESDGFLRGLARGWKTISGKAATYEVHLLADGASIMSLAAGGLSSGYPQPGIYEFLTSGSRVAARAR